METRALTCTENLVEREADSKKYDKIDNKTRAFVRTKKLIQREADSE